MEHNFQTSFIPKSSLGGGRDRAKTPLNVLFMVGSVMLVLTLILVAVLFTYKLLLSRQIVAKQNQLTELESRLDYGAIDEIVRIDRKMSAASILLEQHTSPSKIFTMLESSTLKRLQFTSFQFSYLENGMVALSMKGEAANFGVVARQAELLSSATNQKNASFKNPLFSDVSLDQNGNVTFSFLANIDTSDISYTTNQQ